MKLKFKDYFSLKQIIFAVVLLAIMIPIAIWDSNTQIQVKFYDTSMTVRSDKFYMDLEYAQIGSAELVNLAPAGEKQDDRAYEDDVIRRGYWYNDAWGSYAANIDPDSRQCILLKLTDGQTYVFSRKNDQATQEDYRTLSAYLDTAG